ncbi:MAG: leucine-rich repeat domain-containing protein, partial [Muribaculaceae bacterium]|nr:leucine-rich repeat domain-containing protein [Muribaculaceae bacterium]
MVAHTHHIRRESSRYRLDLTDLTNGKSFTVRAGYLTNSTYSDFNGKLAVALTDATGKIKTTLGNPQNCSFNAVNSIVDSPRRVFTFENCVLTAGITVADTDEVRIVSQAGGSDEWLPLPGELYTCNSISAKPGVPSSFSIKLPAGVAGAKVEGAGSVVKGFDYTFTVTPEAAADENIITVKANGIILTSNNNTYRISNVCADQEISVIVQKASEVIAKRSVWVGSPGTLSSIISESDAANVKDLTVFGSIDARDFNYMRDAMNLERCDLSGVYISAYGSDQANAIPREAFRDERSLKEVILPNSVNRLNNGCFRCSGLTSIVIPSGVSKYEYNVFCSSSNLRDIWVRRDKAEFINWCVLVGINMNNLTLHVPSQTAVNNYSTAENWKDIKNIVVGAPDAVSTVTFAVQEDKEVLFETAANPGQVEKGTKVTFKASHVADNDKKMEVYANATRLYPDADGNYTATIDANTILHFDLIEPQKVMGDSQLWSLNGKNGALGMFTDAINVLPNREFTVRLNALNVSQYSENLYWAIVLTDENSNIKEFISPINTWQAGVGDRHKLNVTCKVTESKVREGNLIRLVCSTNKRDWALVKGVNKSIVDAIPAVNHQDQLYAINLHGITDEDGNIQEIENATISGVESTALRGQDVTLSIVPTSSMYKVDMKVMVKEKDASGEYVKDENGDYKMVVKDVVTRAATVEYPFVALEDMDFEINVYNPAIGTTKVIETYPGGLHIQLTENNVAETVKISGSCRSQDLYDGLNRDWAVKTVKVLDLSELEIVAEGNLHLANEMKHMLFKSPTSTPAVVEKIILPNSILRIWNEGTEAVFGNCKNLEEISLPAGVKSIPFTTGESKMLRYTLGTNVFLGCDKLKVIRIIGEPQTYEGKQCVCYFNPGGYKYGAEYYSLGHPDATKVTVIVPDEYLTLFKTADKNDITGNPWVLYGYNILPESQTPVYGVEFDPSRVNMKDGSENVTQIATFLGDNVPLETISAEGMLFPANLDANATVYVDGEKVDLAEDGSIPVIFHNPKFKPELAKNHRVDVEYTVDLNFHALSDAFTISEPEVEHIGALAEGFMLLSDLEDENENTGNGTEEGAENSGEADTPGVTHSWDTTEVLKPVLSDVRADSR